MKSIILAIAVAAIFTSLGFADVYLEDSFDSGTMSDKWQVLLEGEVYVDEEGCLVIGSKDGEGNTIDTCVALGDDLSSYTLTGSFRLEESSHHSPFLIHVHKSDGDYTFILISKNDPIKLVQMWEDFSFEKAILKQDIDTSGAGGGSIAGAIIGFGLSAALTGHDVEVYDSNINTKEGLWWVVDESEKLKVKEDECYNFKLMVNGDSLQFFIDDELIVDRGLLNGARGALAFSAVDDVRVYLDDILLEITTEAPQLMDNTFKDDFSSGGLSDMWDILMEGEVYVDEGGYLVLGSKDGVDNRIDTCIGIGEDDWRNYRLSGSFFIHNSSTNSPFLVHIHKSLWKNAFLLISEGEPIKLVEVIGPADFIKPKYPNFKFFKTQYAYDTSIDRKVGFWYIYEEAEDFKCKKNQWYDFDLVVEGGKMEFLIDGETAIKYNLLNVSRGSLAFSAVGDAQVYLDGITLETVTPAPKITDFPFEDNFSSGVLSDMWEVLLEGKVFVDEGGYLVLGSMKGEGNRLDTCIGFGEDDWNDYSISGSFMIDNSSSNSPFVIHFHRSLYRNSLIIISKEKPIKLVEVVGSADFIKPEFDTDSLFRCKYAYDAEVRGWGNYWYVHDEAEGFECQEKEWYDFNLIVSEYQAEFFINGNSVLKTDLLNNTRGSLAFSAVDDVRVYLDNVVVELPPQ